MIWFYERRGSLLRFEIGLQVERDRRCRLVIIDPDGTERIEEFEDSDRLNDRRLEIERQLRAAGWNGPHARDV